MDDEDGVEEGNGLHPVPNDYSSAARNRDQDERDQDERDQDERDQEHE